MHILVVNDDGPPSQQSSPYVHTLITHLRRAHHTVSVILPHTQRSWISKAHIVGAPVKPSYFRPGALHTDDGRVSTRPLPQDSKDDEWILIDSTPASCVQLGLFHYFDARGPVDLVLSGPNYGRNTTAAFALSSGTLGAALEAAVCGVRSVALSYAFFDRNHDPDVIAEAARHSVRVVQKLWEGWGAGVQVYSVNVPLVKGVEGRKVLWTYMLQNKWSSGSCFQPIEVPEEEDWGPEEGEMEIRRRESVVEIEGGGGEKTTAEANGTIEGEQRSGKEEDKPLRYTHKHFKWAPRFKDVYDSVERSEPGNDGWAVKEGFTSVTPLKANFMHVGGHEGELKL